MTKYPIKYGQRIERIWHTKIESSMVRPGEGDDEISRLLATYGRNYTKSIQ